MNSLVENKEIKHYAGQNEHFYIEHYSLYIYIYIVDTEEKESE